MFKKHFPEENVSDCSDYRKPVIKVDFVQQRPKQIDDQFVDKLSKRTE
jgi:hypothetical protein